MNTTQTRFYEASKRPMEDMNLIAYPGQPYRQRMYRPGYEQYLNRLQVIEPDSVNECQVNGNRTTIQKLAGELRNTQWLQAAYMGENEFARTVLALEQPKIMKCGALKTYKESVELIVAQWGNGFSSPVHGHAAGYMHEEILFGKMLVNTYRLMGEDGNIVRPLRTDIVGPGTFVSQYSPAAQNARFKRQNLIHNFTSIGTSSSLHYLPEHTRDGRDNGFAVQYFDDYFPMIKKDVTRVTSIQALYSQIGEVILVRSSAVPEYGDHYIVITGRPVVKEHGVRPQDVAIQAPKNKLLNEYTMNIGLTLLKLNKPATEAFLQYHGIVIDNGKVVFPTA